MTGNYKSFRYSKMYYVIVCSVTRSAYVAQARFACQYHISVFRQSQAPTVLYFFRYDVSPVIIQKRMKNKDNVKQIDGNKEEEKDKKDTRRILRLEARVTEDEYAKAAELAQSCGLTMSDYVRRTALGHRPHLRLTEREVEALCSLSDARGDLIRVVAAVKSIQADKRAIYFSDTRFVEQWMKAATKLINRWNQIEAYLNE